MTSPARLGFDRTVRTAVPVALAAIAAGGAAAGGGFVIGDPTLVVMGIGGLLGAVLVVLDADWALGALAVFVVLHLAEVASDFHGAPSLFLPLTGAILLGVAVRWSMTGDRPASAARALLLVGTYVLIAIGSLLFSTEAASAAGTAMTLGKDALVAVLIGLLLGRASSLRVVVWAMVASGGFLAAISVFQFFTGSFDSSFAGFGLSSVENIVGTYDDIRISGPVGDPNFYGQLLIVLLPLALDRMWGETALRLRVMGGVAAAFIAAATVLTFSRGAALAMAVVLIMMAVVYRPSLRSIAAVAIVGAMAIPFMPPGYIDRLTTITEVGTVEGSTDASIRGRTAEVTAGWLMFTDRPLTGVGYGLYDEHYQEYVSGLGIEMRSEARDAHSLYLEVAAETGIFGIVAMGAVIVGAFLALQRGRRCFDELGLAAHSRIARALTASLVGFLITGLFLHLDFARLFWLLIGLALALPTIAEREASARTGAAA